jgi:CRP/FNR family transcriptional regulator, cyclic AMP receptor protein
VRLGRSDSKVDLIGRVPLFEQCSKSELEQVASIADEIDLKEGKQLMREGEPGREFFVILEGTADVIQGGEKVNTLGAGDFFGEIALISHGPRTATVTTASPLRALVVTDRAFQQLVEKTPTIQAKVLAAAVDRLNPKFRREARPQSDPSES